MAYLVPNRVYFQLVKWTAQAAPSQLAKSSGPTNSWLHCRYPKPPRRRQRVASIQCSSLHKRHRVMNGQQITRRWWQRQASPFARWSLRYSFSFIQWRLTGNDIAVGRRSRQYTRLLWITILASCIQNGRGWGQGTALSLQCYSRKPVTQTDLARRTTACDFCQIAQGKTAMEAKTEVDEEKERTNKNNRTCRTD